MTTKTEAQIAHEARNAAAAEAAAERKAQRIARHEEANSNARCERLLKDARNGKGIEVLTDAFAAVCNPTDWRFGFDSVIEGKMNNLGHDTMLAAITFFTLGTPGSIREDDRTEFNADGFAANVWVDPCPVSQEDINMVMEIAEAAGFPVKEYELPKAA